MNRPTQFLAIFTLLCFIAFTSALAQTKEPKTETDKGSSQQTGEVSPTAELLKNSILPESSTNLGITNERYKVDYQVNKNGTFVKEVELIRRFDKIPEISELKKTVFFFNSDLEKIEVKEAFIIKIDGKKISLSKDKIKIQPTPQAEAAPAYSSLKMLTIDHSGIQEKEKVQYKLKVTEERPIFEGVFDVFEFLNPFESWDMVEINVIAPETVPIHFNAVDLEGGKLSDENGQTKWSWNLKNFKAKNIEFGMANPLEYGPYIFISNFSDYKFIGDIYTKEINEKVKITPEIQSLADNLTKGITNKEEQAAAIYGWVNKNIRYLLVFLDRGGWIPRESTKILENGYADCKDYTILLQSLLKAKDIESIPVLVRADTNKNFPEIPVLEYFNHMILYIPALQKFADATVPKTELGELTEVLKGKKGVLVGRNFEVIDLPVDSNPIYKSNTNTELIFQPDGSVKGNSIVTLDEKIGNQFEQFFEKDNNQFFDIVAKTVFAVYGLNGSGSLLNWEKLKEDKAYRLKIETQVLDFVQFSKNKEFYIPPTNFFTDFKNYEILSNIEKRTTPLQIEKVNTNESYKLHFPEGMNVNQLPENIDFTNEFGKYQSQYSLENNVISVERNFILFTDRINTEQYAEFRKLLQAVNEDLTSKFQYTLSKTFKVPKNTAKKDREPVTIEAAIMDILRLPGLSGEPLNPKEVNELEAKLLKNPNDITTRKRLIEHYDIANKTKKVEKSLKEHLKWFIQNQAEEKDNYLTFSRSYSDKTDKEYVYLKNEWLEALAKKPENPAILLNISKFVKYEEPQIAERLLVLGIQKDPENFEFPKLLFEIYKRESESSRVENQPEVKLTLEKTAYEKGEQALSLLKSNRELEADYDRSEILLDLSQLAYKLGNTQRAKELATQLILEYGQNDSFPKFDDVTHIGNIVLGRVALSENKIEEAKEYLLIALRAPLRQVTNYFTPDMSLAKELFDKGEKEVVLEYLNLSEKAGIFQGDSDLYKDEINALKAWKQQINQDKTPSFDFKNP